MSCVVPHCLVSCLTSCAVLSVASFSLPPPPHTHTLSPSNPPLSLPPPLQTLASNGRFGRDLPIEQQTFLVLADTVLKQIDSLKSADTGVGGPVRK